MKPFYRWLALALLPACAHLGLNRGGDDDAPRELWTRAHEALSIPDFERAQPVFQRLAREYPDTEAGRESLFYLGAMHLDPRNPEWDPQPAEEYLVRYVSSDSLEEDPVNRRPEAETFLQLAQQLNLPADERVPGLQPETKVVWVPERVVVPAEQSRALAGEVERLKREVAEKDALIQQQKEELERIRKTLTGKKQ